MQTALRGAFAGPVWVAGDVASLSRRRSLRFELCAPDPERDGSVVKIQAVAFPTTAQRIDRALSRAGVQLGDGVSLRLRGRVAVWTAAGELQLVVEAVDPAFTVGAREAARRALLDDLATSGLATRQAALPPPGIAQRIGLVAAPGTRGAEDLLATLAAEGAPFGVVLAPATVQGPSCERSVAAAIAALVAHHRTVARLDAIAVVRGGGARDDLSGFDGRLVAEAIATAPVPVITGLGHTADRTVADVVAHHATRTPTACGVALCAPVRHARERLTDATGAVVRAAHRRLRHGSDAHARAAQATSSALRRAAASADLRVTTTGARIAVAARAEVLAAWRATDRTAATLTRAARRTGTDAARALDGAAARATTSIRARIATADRRVEGVAREHRALDPQRVLERGYAIVSRADGSPMTAAGSAAGDLVHILMADGSLDATIRDVTSSPEHPDDTQDLRE